VHLPTCTIVRRLVRCLVRRLFRRLFRCLFRRLFCRLFRRVIRLELSSSLRFGVGVCLYVSIIRSLYSCLRLQRRSIECIRRTFRSCARAIPVRAVPAPAFRSARAPARATQRQLRRRQCVERRIQGSAECPQELRSVNIEDLLYQIEGELHGLIWEV